MRTGRSMDRNVIRCFLNAFLNEQIGRNKAGEIVTNETLKHEFSELKRAKKNAPKQDVDKTRDAFNAFKIKHKTFYDKYTKLLSEVYDFNKK